MPVEDKTFGVSDATRCLTSAVAHRNSLLAAEAGGTSVSRDDLHAAERLIGEAEIDLKHAEARAKNARKRAEIAEIAGIVEEAAQLQAQARLGIEAVLAEALHVDAALAALQELVTNYNDLISGFGNTLARCRQFNVYRCEQVAENNATLADTPKPDRARIAVPDGVPEPLRVELLNARAGIRNEGFLLFGQVILATAEDRARNAFGRHAASPNAATL